MGVNGGDCRPLPPRLTAMRTSSALSQIRGQVLTTDKNPQTAQFSVDNSRHLTHGQNLALAIEQWQLEQRAKYVAPWTLNVRECAKHIGISVRTLWGCVESGDLPSFKVSGLRRLDAKARPGISARSGRYA
jgi:hypothetical protein